MERIDIPEAISDYINGVNPNDLDMDPWLMFYRRYPLRGSTEAEVLGRIINWKDQ